MQIRFNPRTLEPDVRNTKREVGKMQEGVALIELTAGHKPEVREAIATLRREVPVLNKIVAEQEDNF